MAGADDPYELSRFIQAQDRRCDECRGRPYCRGRTQDSCYEQALSEVKSGRKVNHWMWYVFP